MLRSLFRENFSDVSGLVYSLSVYRTFPQVLIPYSHFFRCLYRQLCPTDENSSSYTRVIPSRFLRLVSHIFHALRFSPFFSRAYVSEKRKISKFQTSVRIIQESRVYFFFKFFSWIRRLLRTFLLKIEKFKEIYRHTDTLTYTCSCISLKSKLNYQNK